MRWTQRIRTRGFLVSRSLTPFRITLIAIFLISLVFFIQIKYLIQGIEEEEKNLPHQDGFISPINNAHNSLSDFKKSTISLPHINTEKNDSNVMKNSIDINNNNNITTPLEIIVHDNPGTIYNATFLNSSHEGGPFITSIKRLSYCHYEIHNFCIDQGTLLFFHDLKTSSGKFKAGLRACNEFSRHSPSIYIKYWSNPIPNNNSILLPGPLNTITKGWILQFWCQDLFHMTLSLLPAFHTTNDIGQSNPDIYIRIARGKRHKGGYCNVKLGDPTNFENTRNSKYGKDKQFPFAGNPFWSFYRILTNKPEKIHPLVSGESIQTACYRHGVIDKRYIKSMTSEEARNYSNKILNLMEVPLSSKTNSSCKSKYRLTLIDRRGRTRRLTNINEILNLAKEMNFDAQSVAFETIPIREQLKIVTMTDILIGVHGNGLMWLQFLPINSVVIELVGVWYTPYALLWGHHYFHSRMINNPEYVRKGEFQPFAHNLTEIKELLFQAKEALDKTRCGEKPFQLPNEQLANLYKSCAPHC